MGSIKSLIQPSNNKSSPSYRLHNVRAGYVLYRALVYTMSFACINTRIDSKCAIYTLRASQ